MTIVCRTPNPTVVFAAQELQRHLRMMMPEEGGIPIGFGADGAGIHLGTFADFGLPEDGFDPALDDVLHIRVAAMQGVIAGSNPRSVLMACYRFLHENGCRWPRPGVDGACIPQKRCGNVAYDHQAAHRTRGLCIEGAVSQQNMLDNIDWAPKVFLNTYFLEFEVPFTFYDRWYSHHENPSLPPEPVSVEGVRQYAAGLEAEIAKRGLAYHAVGHAWTCGALGVPGLGWDAEDVRLDEGDRELLAMIDGRRELFDGVPLNTNLCYSNPRARARMVRYCTDYADRNRQVDYLHVWLADALNNFCECEECQKSLPSDLYVRLLNELDAAFTERGIGTKIVLLLYVDLLWPPIKERLNDPGRFRVLFAPITRTYNQPYTAQPFEGELPPYRRNRLEFPRSLKENIAYLREWKKNFPLEGFAYEYYFWNDHYNDPGYTEIAALIYKDVQQLHAIGLDGLISDQTQRSFFPTGLPMYVMAQTLYDTNAAFEDLAGDFYSSCFGAGGGECRRYLEELTLLFSPTYLRGSKEFSGGPPGRSLEEYVNSEAADRLAQVPGLVARFRPVAKQNLHSGNRCRDLSWRYLLYHGELCTRMAAAFLARAQGSFDQARELWEAVLEYARSAERELQEVFDVYSFAKAHRNKI